jgi:hypothetical protein
VKTTRFQIRRSKGWRKPAGGIICSRPSKWGNLFVVVKMKSTEDMHQKSVAQHRDWLKGDRWGRKIAMAAKKELKGKKLGCWCAMNKACHVDNLIDAAEGRL